MDFKQLIAKNIWETLEYEMNCKTEYEKIFGLIEIPPNASMGDFSFPCFMLAKELRLAPNMIAQNFTEKIKKNDKISKVENVGAYVNFFLNRGIFAAAVLKEIQQKGAEYGSCDIGKGGIVAIDYSSPNIAKPFHIGHLRSTNIGAALYNIYNMLGYKSYGINFLGDWGTQFGKVITAFRYWSNREAIESGGIDELNRLYVLFHDEAETNPALNDEARMWLVKMEQGDEYALELWRWFSDISLVEYKKIYERLGGTNFDSWDGESFYNDKMQSVVEELKEKGLLVESDGAMVIDLEEFKMPPCLILRKDGGTLYPTRDIASAVYRKNKYNFVKAIYVTAIEQNLHFAQWFKVVELMGYEWAKDLIHLHFGFLNFSGGKISTRKGNAPRLGDLLDKAVNKILEIIETKNPNLKNKEQIAEQVGIGALKFADLYNNRIKDVEFSWERMLNFDGETGPYVQYTHARCVSVLRKAGDYDYGQADIALLTNDDEFALIKALAAYPAKIIEAADKLEPYIISRHIMLVAQAYNKFYHDNPILRAEEEELKAARLFLTDCTKMIISAGLGILGIASPNEM